MSLSKLGELVMDREAWGAAIHRVTKSRTWLSNWTELNLLASLLAQRVKRLPAMRESPVQSPGWEDLLEKEMATHSSFLAWRIPRTEKPGRLQSMGSQRVGHDWATSLSLSISLANSCSDIPLALSQSMFSGYVEISNLSSADFFWHNCLFFNLSFSFHISHIS